MTRKTPRRDFLLGCLADVKPQEPAAPQASEPCLLRVSRRAMACEFEICLPAAIAGEAAAVAMECLDLVQSLESQLSFFRNDSEISEINRHAADGPVEVEPRLFELLQLAMHFWKETNGAYDITAGPLWEVWGFARRAAAIPTPEQLSEALSRVGGQFVELDAANRTVRFLRRGMQLNLGSIGKGYAVDRCAELMQASGVVDFLVHGGYSSVAARGVAQRPLEKDACQAKSLTYDDGTAWSIGVKDPLRDDRRLGQLELHDRALGTSGTQFQSFRHQGRRYGHILDPRSGWPADGVLAATVLAPTAARADALSTAFYVLGPQAALDYCGKCPDISALLFTPAHRPGGWELHHAGPASELGDLQSKLG